jgi:hypothetical protein
MKSDEKAEFTKKIKKQAAYLMLNVSTAVEAKDFVTAKSLLIFIADSCSII